MNRREAPAFLSLVLVLLLLGGARPALAAATRLVEPPPQNLLRNSSFAGGDYWVLRGDKTSVATDRGRKGDGAAALVEREEYAAEVVQTVGPSLVPGRRYTVTAWVKATAPDSVAVLGVRWQGAHPRVFRGVRPADGWSKIEFRFTAPEADGWKQVVLGGVGGLLWDDVGLYEADSLEARLAMSWEERLNSPEPTYTGLVVNALGTSLERGMTPSIYDEGGNLIFAGIGAGEGQLVSRGIVAYATDLKTGVSHPRLRVSEIYPLRLPLVVDAQGTRGNPRTDVVIGDADARLIRRAIERYDFLGRFAIVFVLEPFSGL